jgi:hypothetical protein
MAHRENSAVVTRVSEQVVVGIIIGGLSNRLLPSNPVSLPILLRLKLCRLLSEKCLDSMTKCRCRSSKQFVLKEFICGAIVDY